MANIIEEFLIKREFAFAKNKYFDVLTLVDVEEYALTGRETLDGLKLRINVETAYSPNGVPVAQDFVIKSNRGIMRRTTAHEVFEVLRVFL